MKRRLSFGSRMAILRREFPRRISRAIGALAGRDAFKGSEVNRLLSDWTSTLAHPDDETRWSLRRLRSRSRDLAKNNPVVRQYLTQLTVNVVGPTGIHHQARVRNNSGDLNKLFNDRIEEAWEEWSYDPTVGGGQSLTDFSHLLLKTIANDGEVFIRLWRGFNNASQFALEAIDADQVDELYNWPASSSQQEIRSGIQVDAFGRPTGYWVWSKPAMVIGQDPNRTRKLIPADQIIHLYDPLRINQSRGVPWIFPVMVPLRMLEGYVEAELVAARTAASKMGFFERKDTGDGTLPEANEDGSLTMEANPGTFGFTPEGYTLKDWSPQHPNTAFGDFVKGAMRQIASGLRVSYNSLANDLEGVNYSSMRSGLLIERDVWRTLQRWWICSFVEPVYEEWMNMALLSGALVLDSRDKTRFLDAEWSPRGWSWVDPLKDTEAAVLAIQSGLGSRSMALAEQGYDYEDVIEQLAEEQRMADEAGVKVSGPPAPVTAPKPPSESGNSDDEPSTNGSGEVVRGVPGARIEAILSARKRGSRVLRR